MNAPWRQRLQAACRRFMLTADGMTPPGLDDDKRLQLERRMLDLLIGGVRQVLLTSIIIGPLLTTWLIWPQVGPLKSLVLLALLLALGAERVLLLRRIARERAMRDDNPRRWATAIGWRVLLGGIVILVGFYFVVESGDRILISQMLALLTILAAGGAALFSSWPPVMWAVISVLLPGMAVQLFMLGDPERMVEGVFCIVLWLVLVSACLRSARALHSEALTRLQNEDLLRALHERNAQVEEANAAKSRFFAAANHDLRQPLQAMSLYLGVLQPTRSQAANADDQQAATLARLRQCMAALDGLVVSLLDFSRLEAGQVKPEPRAVPLQPLLDRLAGMYEAVARQKDLQLRVRPTAAWARTDPVLLERALANLLANAIRYTHSGGVLLGVRRRGGALCVCVVDTGIGIPEHARDAIYEEFVQLNNPVRDAVQGHGLGLSTVRRIAMLLEHPLDLRSREGRGSIFTLHMPEADPSHALGAMPAAPEPSTRLQGHVLVVEDNALVRDALVQQLTGWGLVVQAAHDGEQAMAAIAAAAAGNAHGGAFDIVLSDWRLPGPVDGLAVLRQAHAHLPELRLGLLITGEDEALLSQLSPEFPVLRKPLRPLRLRTLLTRHLRAC